MTEERRHDLGKYLGNLTLSAIIGSVSCLITLYATTNKLEARVTVVEKRQERLTQMIDHLDGDKVDKDTFKEVLEQIKSSIDGLRSDIRDERGRR